MGLHRVLIKGLSGPIRLNTRSFDQGSDLPKTLGSGMLLESDRDFLNGGLLEELDTFGSISKAANSFEEGCGAFAQTPRQEDYVKI